MDDPELALLTDTLRRTMTTVPGTDLDRALERLGWPDLLAASPDVAAPLVFRLLGETGAHAPLINDVMLQACGLPVGATVPLSYVGGGWVVWERSGRASSTLDSDLPLRRAAPGEPVWGGGPWDVGDAAATAALSAGRRALGWWLVGTGRAMLALARDHALQRVQFGRSLATFQAVRHRLAEALVAVEGAQATLLAANDDLGSLLAKAAAGQAALTTARHCQQVLGGMGFTAEHDHHRHVRRALVLDGLLGSARELTREAGALVRARGCAPRLAQL